MNSMDDLDLRMSEEARPFFDKVLAFVNEVVEPMQQEFHRLGEGRADRWSYAPGQLELLEEANAALPVEDHVLKILPLTEELHTGKVRVEAQASGDWDHFLEARRGYGPVSLRYYLMHYGGDTCSSSRERLRVRGQK